MKLYRDPVDEPVAAPAESGYVSPGAILGWVALALAIWAVCLGTLWACVTVGCRLALGTIHRPTLTQVVASAMAIAASWLVVHAVRLLVADLRHPDVGRQL